jgi:hypothetical protein
MGVGSNASGFGSTAVGAGASAAFAGSTAIGAGAVANAPGQVMLGTAANTYQAPGITSAASLASQVGPTAFTTTDAAGHLATSNFGPQDIAALQSGVLGLSQSVTDLQGSVRRGYEGTAVAVALGGASYLPENKWFAVTGNFGTFRGQYGLAAQAQLRVNDWMVVNAGVGAGLKHGGVAGRAGVTFAW